MPEETTTQAVQNDRYAMDEESEALFLEALSKDKKEVPVKEGDKEPPKATPDPVVPAEEDDNEPVPTVLKGKAVDEWKKLKQTYKSQLKQRETELSTLKAEYEKAKTTPTTAPVDNTVVETMRKERDELVEQIRQLDVEKDPIIKQQFDTKLDSLRARAKTYVSPEQQDALDFALRIPEGPLRKVRLKDIYDSLESYEAVQLATLVSRLDDVSADREAQVGLMRSKYGELQNWRKENEIKVRKEFEGVFEQQVETMRRDPSMAMLQPIPGNDQHNKMVEGVLNAARSQYQGKLPADQLARNAVFSAMTPFIVQHAMNVTKRAEELEAKLKKIEAASPGFEESGGKVATEANEDGPAKGENYQDYLQRSFSAAIKR